MTRFPSVRTTGLGALQTAVIRYEHSTTSQTVTIVGTVHIADAVYWRQLNTMISALEDAGSVVHYEATKPPTEEERATLSPDERRMLEVCETKVLLQGLIADLVGMVPQRDGLSPRDEWVNADITLMEMIRALDPQTVPDLPYCAADVEAFRLADRSKLSLVTRLAVYVFSLVLKIIMRLVPVTINTATGRRLSARCGDGWFKDSVVVDVRNRVAVDRMLQETRPVVMVWGAGHLSGIGELMLTHGFVPRSVKWFTALRGIA